jgi:hypothetical protein
VNDEVEVAAASCRSSLECGKMPLLLDASLWGVRVERELKKSEKIEIRGTKKFLLDGTVACPMLFGRERQRAKNGEFEKPSGKTICEKTLLFSEKTSLRDRGFREDP